MGRTCQSGWHNESVGRHHCLLGSNQEEPQRAAGSRWPTALPHQRDPLRYRKGSAMGDSTVLLVVDRLRRERGDEREDQREQHEVGKCHAHIEKN